MIHTFNKAIETVLSSSIQGGREAFSSSRSNFASVSKIPVNASHSCNYFFYHINLNTTCNFYKIISIKNVKRWYSQTLGSKNWYLIIINILSAVIVFIPFYSPILNILEFVAYDCSIKTVAVDSVDFALFDYKKC